MSVDFVTKILPPSTNPDLIERHRLHELVSGLEFKKAIVLTAPAGYGKTVYLTQLTTKIAKPVVWYHLDSEDNDPAIFFQYLKTALHRQVTVFTSEPFTLSEPGNLEAKVRYLTAMLVNNLALKATAGLTIVFDDLHVISNSVIHGFFQEFLTYLPSNIHLLIASRTPLPFPVTKMLINKEVSFLGVDELSFDRKETEAYVQQFGKMVTGDVGLIDRLQQSTEGWPVALRLAVETQAPLSFPTKEKKVLFDYLANEVLAQLPRETREFLLTTCILEVLTPQLCNLLTKRHNAEQVLSDLLKKQLFITQLSTEKNIYRYHQLFREFLQVQLGDDYPLLAYRAAEIFTAQENWEQALRYYLAAQAPTESVHALEKAGRSALNNGRWQTVLNWLQAVPFSVLESNPWLLLYQAEIEVFRGCIGAAEKWAQKAAILFKNTGDNAGLTQTKILQARVFCSRGMFFKSLELLAEGEKLLPSSDQRLDLVMERAVSLYLTGSFQAAEELLLSALGKAKSQNNHFLLPYMLEGLGNIYYLMGDFPRALSFFKEGMKISPEGYLPGYHTQDHMSVIYSDWGELEQALELAKRNVALKERFGLVETLPSAYTHLAGIQTDLGAYEEAEENYQKVITLLKGINGELIYLALSLAFYARCLWLQGKIIEAKAKIEEALAIKEIKDSICYGSCQSVGGLILYQAGESKEGERILLEAVSSLEKIGFTKAVAYACQALAALYFAEENQTQFLAYTEKALTLSAQLNYVQNFLTCYEVLTPLFRAGIEHNIELSFIQRIIVRLGTRAYHILAPLTCHSDSNVRKRVCFPLAELQDDEAYQALLRLTADENVEVSKTALRLLARHPRHAGTEKSGAQSYKDYPLKLHTLGQLQILINGIEIPDARWRTKKAKHLLAYLAHQGGPVSKEKIIDDLWPQSNGEEIDALFHTTLYRLRKALSPVLPAKIVSYTGGRYQLLPDYFQTDQAKFEELLISASRPELSPEKTASILEKAVTLYRGDYLEDLDYPWTVPLQERLRHLLVAARIRLGRYYLSINDYAKAINHLHSLLGISNLSEEVHSLLMMAYAGLGDLKAVRKQFRTMTVMFREELGLSPSPEIIDLYYKLVSKTVH